MKYGFFAFKDKASLLACLSITLILTIGAVSWSW